MALGISVYLLIHAYQTSNQLKAHGYQIPSVFLVLIPLVGIGFYIWWLVKYSEACSKLSHGRLSQAGIIILGIFFPIFMMAYIHNTFNKFEAQASTNPQGLGAANLPQSTNPYLSQPPVPPVNTGDRTPPP